MERMPNERKAQLCTPVGCTPLTSIIARKIHQTQHTQRTYSLQSKNKHSMENEKCLAKAEMNSRSEPSNEFMINIDVYLIRMKMKCAKHSLRPFLFRLIYGNGVGIGAAQAMATVC